ncbi:unnamed protein product [Periconia digitata]|uniref:Uncharacterized protein n=1 Tax=Periconia digitata TaxID=1303443 RepID=A0A9W4U7Z9_9PLEO|nr:unnamed protein product [Periconia digitata]
MVKHMLTSPYPLSYASRLRAVTNDDESLSDLRSGQIRLAQQIFRPTFVGAHRKSHSKGPEDDPLSSMCLIGRQCSIGTVFCILHPNDGWSNAGMYSVSAVTDRLRFKGMLSMLIRIKS